MSRVSVIGSICQLKKSITQRKASIAVQILKWPFLLFFAPYFISKKIQKKNVGKTFTLHNVCVSSNPEKMASLDFQYFLKNVKNVKE